MELFGGQAGEFGFAEFVVVQGGLFRFTVQAVELQEVLEEGLAEETDAGALAHAADFRESWLLGDEVCYGFRGLAGVAEAIHGAGVAGGVEENGPGEGEGGVPEVIEHLEGLGPGVGWERFDFGEEVGEEVEFGEEFDAAAGVGAGEDAGEFVPGSFGGDRLDLRALGANGGGGLFLDGEGETAGESNRAEEAEMVFGEALGRWADGADGFVGEVGLAADEVEDCLRAGVVEETVDGEVAAGCVAGWTGFELDRRGMAAVGIGAVGTEGGDFDAAVEDDAEVGADGFGAGEELEEFGRLSIGGDVPVLRGAIEEHVADAAADEEGLMAGGVEGLNNLFGRGGDLHPYSLSCLK